MQNRIVPKLGHFFACWEASCLEDLGGAKFANNYVDKLCSWNTFGTLFVCFSEIKLNFLFPFARFAILTDILDLFYI